MCDFVFKMQEYVFWIEMRSHSKGVHTPTKKKKNEEEEHSRGRLSIQCSGARNIQSNWWDLHRAPIPHCSLFLT